MKRSIRFASRLFALPLLAAFAVVLVAAMAGPAQALVLDGTPQTYSGTPSGTSTPGINGTYFEGFTGYDPILNLDGATYFESTTRCFTGTQGLLNLTATTSVVNYMGVVQGFSMLSVPGDHFYTGWSGTFTPQDSGTHWFEWHNDDRGTMYIDINGDGIFQSTDRVGLIDWNSNASVELTEDIAYNFIYMTADGGGGYNNDWYMRTPTLTSNTRPNASDSAQAGMWNVGSITYGPLDFSDEDLIVNATTTLTLNSSSNVPFRLLLANDGTATINGTLPSISFTGTTVAAAATSGISTAASVTLGPVTIGNGSTLIATGTGAKTATSITLSGATGGITAGGTFNMGTYSDGGNVKTLTLGGTGTKVMDNSGGLIVAGNTTLRLVGGTLDTTSTASSANDPLGGSMAIELSGAKLKMSGQIVTSTGALRAGLYYHNDWDPNKFIGFHRSDSDLSETPSLTAVDTGLGNSNGPGINYNGNFQTLFPGMPSTDHFSVAWTGEFTAKTSGNHTFQSYWGDDAWKMYIDLNQDGTFTENENLGGTAISLTEDRTYKVAFGFAEWEGGENVGYQFWSPTIGDWRNVNPAAGEQGGMWSYSTMGALDMTGRTVQVDAASEINMVTDSGVAFGALTVNNGVVTITGTVPSTSFAGTTVDAAATLIGFSGAGTIDAGVIDGNDAIGTFVKAGGGTLTLNAGNTGLGNMVFDVQGGNLIAVASGSFGGSAAAQLSGGTLKLSSAGGTTAYDIGLDVTMNSTLTAGKAAGGDDSQTVDLGSDSKLLTVRNGKTLAVNATDSYVLNINNSVALEDNATMNFNAANGNIKNIGAADLSMGDNSTINLNAGTLTTDKALDVYNLNLNGGLLTQVTPQDLNVRGTLKIDNSATNLEITGAASLTTTSSATINLVNGTLTTDKALSVGNLTVESGGTLNRTGDLESDPASRDVSVSGQLRLANKSFSTVGSTLSVSRIQLEGSSTLSYDNELTFNQLWMNSSTTLNPGANTTINGQIELYDNSQADFSGVTLTVPNWQNLYVHGTSQLKLKAGTTLNVNYVQIWDGQNGGTPISGTGANVVFSDRLQLMRGVYGVNFVAANESTDRRMYIWNDGEHVFTGTNTYNGRTEIGGGENSVMVANEGVGLPTTSTVSFQDGIWGTSGSITRTISSDHGGNVVWDGWGGFAAYGGPLTVTLTTDEGAGAKLYWNSNTRGFNNQGLHLGSQNATHNVELTNNIEINSYAQIRTNSRTKLATLSGNLTGGETLDKQGPGTLVLTGDNSGFSGRMYIRRGVLDVGNLTTGKGLGTGRVDLQADTDDPYWKGAILQANGLLAKTIGSDLGNVRWDDNGGGFAARGGSLTVTLNTDATINWNDDPSGFRGRRLMFGSGTADDVVTLTNNIDAQNGYRYIYAFDNPNSANDKAVLSGNLMNLSGFEKRGDGVLETKGNAGLLSTSGDQVRIYDGGTLKVNGNLRAGDEYTETEPRYIGSSDRNVENYDGKLIVTGNVQANWYYGGGSAANSSNDITGNLTIRSHYEQNEGTAHIGGNLQTGAEWVGVRNTTVLTVDGNIRSGAPNGSAADRDVYSWGGGRMIVGGDVAANRLYFEQGKAANGQLPGITVGGTVNLQDGIDLRTGSSTMNNVNSPNYVNLYYGAELTVNGNLVTNSINANEWDYWYGTGRGSAIHLNGATAVINSGDGNININANNPSTGYGVLDGSATVSANNVSLWNKAMLGGTLTLNVKDKVEIGENSVLAPGNSAGTLIIGKNSGTGGNLQMNNGSEYWFDGGDMVNVGGQLTVNDNWTLDLLTGGQRLVAGGSLTLFNYGTLGTFDDTPTYDVSALITAGWLPGDFDTGTLNFTTTGGSIVLNGIQLRPPVWTGGNSDPDNKNWATGDNWDLPAEAGSVLQFAGSVKTTNNNNFTAGTSFSGIVFNAGADTFTLEGESINLNGDIVNNSSNPQNVNLPIVLSPTTKVDTKVQDMAMGGNLSGTDGWLTKIGSGTLALTGINTQTGGTAINEGTVAIAAGNTLGAAVKFAGGTLSTTAPLSSSAALNVTSADGTLSDNGNNLTFSGVNSGTGTLTKNGAGTLSLTGPSSTLSGTINLTGGKLVATAASLAGPVAMTNNTNVTLNGAGTYEKSISGQGSLTKDGAGTLTLTSAQGYDGATLINNGTLKLQGTPTGFQYYKFTPTQFKGEGNSVQLSEFQYFWNNTWTQATTVTNPGGDNPGGERPANANDNDTGNKWLDFNKGPLVYDFSVAKAFNEYNWVTGNDSTDRDPIRWKIEGSDDNATWTMLDDRTGEDQSVTNDRNTWVAPDATRYSGWSLSLPTGASSDLLPITTAVRINSSATLDLNNCNQQIASLADAVPDSTTGHRVLLGSGTLTIDGSASTVFSGAISGAGGLVKAGLGTLTLTGANDYTGDTIVEGGTLSINSAYLSDTAAVKITTTMDLNFVGNDTVGSVWLGDVKKRFGYFNFSTWPDYFTDNTGSLFVAIPAGNYWAPGAVGGQGGTTDHLTSIAEKWDIEPGYQGQGVQAATGALIFTDDPTGTVTVDGPVTANAGLTFEVGGYVLAAGTTPEINLAGAAADNIVTVATGTATIGVDLSGANGMTKVGNGTLILGGNNTMGGTVNVLVGQLTLASGTTAISNAGEGTVGSLKVSDSGVTIASDATVTVSGEELVVRNGATMEVSGTVNITPTDGSGTYGRVGAEINGGDPATPEAAMILKDSAKLNAPDTFFIVGDQGLNDGRLTIQDSAELNASTMVVGQYGRGTKGTVIQNGGTVTLTYAPSGLWYITPALQIGSAAFINWGEEENGTNWGDGQGEYHLNGGTLTAHSIGGGGGANGGSSKFYFNGGLLKPTVNDEDVALALAGMADQGEPAQTLFMQYLTQVVVQAGGAKIDTNGHNITIDQVLEHDAALEGTPDGGLTKTGDGTLALPGANTYTGATTITAGTLLVNGTHTGGDNYTVSGTGTLGGTGTITLAPDKTVTVQSGGALAPGASAGTLTIDNANYLWNGGGKYVWETTNTVGTPGTDWDLLKITGTGAMTFSTGSADVFIMKLVTLVGALPGWDADGSTETPWIKVAEAASGINNFDAGKFSFDTAGWSPNLVTGDFQMRQNPLNLNELELKYVPVLTYEWKADPDTNQWHGGDNWSRSWVPTLGKKAVFGTTLPDDAKMPKLYDDTREVRALEFQRGGWTLYDDGGLGAHTLTVFADGIASTGDTDTSNTIEPTIQFNGDATVTVGADHTLYTASLVSPGTLTKAGAGTLDTGLASVTANILDLTVGILNTESVTATTFNVGGTSSAVSGAVNVSGTTTVTSSLTAGSVTGGDLTVEGTASITGAVTVGTLNVNAGSMTAGVVTANAFNVNSGSAAIASLTGSGTDPSASVAADQSLQVGTFSGLSTVTVDGTLIAGAGDSSADSLSVAATGRLELRGSTLSVTNPMSVGGVLAAAGEMTSTVSSPVNFADGSTAEAATDNTLVLGATAIAADGTLTKTGAGTVTFGGTQNHGAGAVLQVGGSNGGRVNLNTNAGTLSPGPGTPTVANLLLRITGSAGGDISRVVLGSDQVLAGLDVQKATGGLQELDLNDKAVRVFPANVGTLEQAIRTMISASRTSGDGIYDSTAAVTERVGYTDRRWDANGQQYVAIRTVYGGDANMDGRVDIGDAGILGGNYGKAGVFTWDQGDLNYDGVVNIGDAGILGGNYGKTGGNHVPEPATLSLLALGGLALLHRRHGASS